MISTELLGVGICISFRKIPPLPIPVLVNTFLSFFILFYFFILNHLKLAYIYIQLITSRSAIHEESPHCLSYSFWAVLHTNKTGAENTSVSLICH